MVKGWKPKPRPNSEPTMPRTIPQSDIPKLHKPKWYTYRTVAFFQSRLLELS